MYASSQFHPYPISTSTALRWSARTIAVVLMAAWVVYVVAEFFRPDFGVVPSQLYQGGALAMVFAGYVVGWRRELAGGLLTIAGTAAFFVVSALTVGTWPSLAAAWFAAPGVLYLEAWRRERFGKHPTAA